VRVTAVKRGGYLPKIRPRGRLLYEATIYAAREIPPDRGVDIPAKNDIAPWGDSMNGILAKIHAKRPRSP